MTTEPQSLIDALDEKNAWRGGLSEAEKTCFEAGWDAALSGEHQRLKDAVVEAAKKWMNFCNNDAPWFSDTQLANVINELVEFEQKQ